VASNSLNRTRIANRQVHQWDLNQSRHTIFIPIPSATNIPRKRSQEPKFKAARLLLILGLLGLPLADVRLTYYSMDKFQSKRDSRIRWDPQITFELGGASGCNHNRSRQNPVEGFGTGLPAANCHCRASETAQIRYQNNLTYSIRLPGNLLLEPKSSQKSPRSGSHALRPPVQPH